METSGDFGRCWGTFWPFDLGAIAWTVMPHKKASLIIITAVCRDVAMGQHRSKGFNVSSQLTLTRARYERVC